MHTIGMGVPAVVLVMVVGSLAGGVDLDHCDGGDCDTAAPDAASRYTEPETDDGYLMFCPCMGRFGNQMDHYLSALALAVKLNRTLVAPPFVFYDRAPGQISLRPVDAVFSLGRVSEYHRIIPLAQFMADVAPTVWPPPRRAVCHGVDRDCAEFRGNPFVDFWRSAGVEFAASPASAAVTYSSSATEWETAWPRLQHRVIALTGAPGPFPGEDPAVRRLQGLFAWTEPRRAQAAERAKRWFGTAPWIAAHIRMGPDWVKACKIGVGMRQFFASPQCTLPEGRVSTATCTPTVEHMAAQLAGIAKATGAAGVFVGTDSRSTFAALDAQLTGAGLLLHQLPENAPLEDLALFSIASHFVGNCVSSFTAVTVRERQARGEPSDFWGVP